MRPPTDEHPGTDRRSGTDRRYASDEAVRKAARRVFLKYKLTMRKLAE